MEDMTPVCPADLRRGQLCTSLPHLWQADPVVPVASTKRFEAALKAALGACSADDSPGRRDATSPTKVPPTVLSEYPQCSHLDYVLELITFESTPPLIHFLRETCWDRM